MNREYDVLIVGGGPIGLFLGCRLRQLGVDAVVLEKDDAPRTHSRSIGIHPPSLERLSVLGLADAFIAAGLQIRTGRAFAGERALGTLSFTGCPGPYPFILTLPQYETERLLADRLRSLAPDALWPGATVEDVRAGKTNVTVAARWRAGAWIGSARWVVGCDGKNSLVRNRAGIAWRGDAYPDVYVLGDFKDRTGWGSEARIHTGSQGLVESFPLTAHLRRWVVRTGRYEDPPRLDDFCRDIFDRTGFALDPRDNELLNSFRIERRRAERLFAGRILLAGDAAHVVSPIGGQGMNLGWINAWDLAESLRRVLHDEACAGFECAAWERRAMRRARRAARRAEFNMAFGRAGGSALLRTALLWALLHTPARAVLARLFTMRGL